MRNIPTLVGGIALVIAISGCRQQPTGVAAAAEAMGAMNLNTIEYSASGSQFAFGQAASPGGRWARPRTIQPDALSKSPKPATIETVGDKKVLADSSRTIELYHMKNGGHNSGTLIAYLLKERILMYGDGYNPPAGDDPRDPSRTLEYGLQLNENVQRLKLNPTRIAPVHGRVVPYENLKIAIGATPTT